MECITYRCTEFKATERTDPGNCAARPTSNHMADSYYESLFAVSAAAQTITTHLDFYNWLQRQVFEIIPHDVLLVAWGDFASGELSYDVSSALPGLTTQSACDFSGLDTLLVDFFKHMQKNDRYWYLLRDFDPAANGSIPEAEFGFEVAAELNMKSALVYTMTDKRDSHDCMYVFCSRDSVIDINPLPLDLLMPHVDAALRKVECLSKATGARKSGTRTPIDSLSEREREVLHWVGMGKSNEEIGAILCISHNTVKNHLKRIFSKMNVSARSQAVQVYSEFNGHGSSSATL